MRQKCENCGEVDVTADTFTMNKDGKKVPSSGVCPICKRRIIWANEIGEPMTPVSGGLRDLPKEKDAQGSPAFQPAKDTRSYERVDGSMEDDEGDK